MTKKLLIVLAMLLVASFAFAQQSPSGQGPTYLNGGLTGTPGGFPGSGPNNQGGPGLGRHDLKDANSGNPIGCESCHLPHTAPTYGTAFLWAWRNMPTSLNTYYTLANPSGMLTDPLSGAGPATAIPTGNNRSMLCFTCHDGTSMGANGIIGGNTINGTPYPLVYTSGGKGSIGNQHPVDAIVPTTTDYVQPITVSGGMFGMTATIGVDALPLWDAAYHVECQSCHDVHNDWPTPIGGGSPGQGGQPFLRQANINGTYLCRECHNAQ